MKKNSYETVLDVYVTLAERLRKSSGRKREKEYQSENARRSYVIRTPDDWDDVPLLT